MQRVVALLLPALLPALLAGSLGLNLWSIDFGQPSSYDQCVDAVLPVLSLDAVDNVFGERHVGGTKYPRLHFVIVGAVQRGWFTARYGEGGAAERLGPVMDKFYNTTAPDQLAWRRAFRPHEETISELIVVGRVVSAIMGMLCVLAIFLFARELISRSAGLIAGAIVGASYPFVYYAHTCNVDVPYLMWGMFAFYAAVRAVRTGRGGWLVTAAALAALSAGTKDQAGAWFVFTAPALLWLMRAGLPVIGGRAEGSDSTDSSPRRVPWAAVGVAALVSVSALAFSNGLPFDMAGARAHFDHIFGVGHTDFREFEPGFRGQWLLLGESLLHLKDTMGAQLLIVSGVGALLLLVRHPRVAMLTLLPAVSYYALFIGSIGYVYLRFTLPIFLMLAVAAAFVFDFLYRFEWMRVPAVLIALGSIGQLGYTSARMVSMMDQDPRTSAEAWLEHEAPTARIAAVIQIPIHNIEFPPGTQVRYVDVTTTNPGYGDNPPELVVSSSFDPPRKLEPAPTPPELPSVRLFARDYDRVAAFEPVRDHAVLQGISFQPRISIYRLRPRPGSNDPAPADGAGDSEGTSGG